VGTLFGLGDWTGDNFLLVPALVWGVLGASSVMAGEGAIEAWRGSARKGEGSGPSPGSGYERGAGRGDNLLLCLPLFPLLFGLRLVLEDQIPDLEGGRWRFGEEGDTSVLPRPESLPHQGMGPDVGWGSKGFHWVLLFGLGGVDEEVVQGFPGSCLDFMSFHDGLSL